jgi:hypothetical protein
MVNLLYLVVPIAVALVVGLTVTLARRRPRSMEDGLREFERELGALAPEPRPSARRRRASRKQSVG